MNRPAFILDMDGVLVDSNPLHAHAWRVYLLQHGISADSILEQMHGKRNDQIVRTLFGRQLTDAEVFTHGAAKEKLYRELMRPQLQSHLLPGLVPFLERHRQRPMGVASNAEPANIDFVLDEGQLRPFFPVAVAGNRVRNPKPDPEIYLLAASLLGVSPADCVVFEDSPTGIEAAKSAGARVVGVESTPAVLPDTDFRIRDFTDPGLDEWLAGLNGGGQAMNFAIRATAWILILVPVALAQQTLTLEEAIERTPSDFRPVREGVKATVKGIVTSRRLLFGEYAQIPISDGKGHGLLLEAPDFMFEHVTPGDHLEVRGVLAQRGGMPVFQPSQLTTLSHSASPAPLPRPVEQLQSISAVGLTVVTEARVVALGEDIGGSYLLLDDGQQILYPVYLPKAAARIGVRLARYHVGDRVRVTGTASQAAVEPPYNTKFRLVIADASYIELLERDSFIAPQLLLAGLLTLVTVLFVAVHSHQRRRAIRRSTRRIHGLCEELLSCTSVEDVLRKLRNIAPRAIETSGVELYRFDRASQMLRRMLAPQQNPVSVANAKGNGGSSQAIALCFRNRTPLCIPDTRRSALFRGAPREVPRGLVLLPTFAREELTGILEIVSFDRPRHFYIEELTALQHLANQIAMLLKLIEQQARKEQVLRSERLAATGEIISGVAGELKGPLDSILSLAHRLLDHGDSEVRAIVRESLRATAILSRYSQAAVSGESETSPIEVNAILARAVESSRKEIPSELTLDLSLSSDPLWIEGSPSQLENVFSNLLLLAARSAKPSLERTLRVESSLLIRRVIITIRYGTLFFDETLSAGALPPDQSGLGFGVCRGIVHSMGGDVRIVRAAENSCRIEIDLPAAFPTQEPAASPEQNERQPSRALTALILEPEASSQRRLISYWTSRHHRAVPIHDEGEALELLRRLRIDVIFCALRTGGGNWVEFFDRIRGHVPAFVLLAEGLGSDASTLFPEGEGFVLRKPLEAGEMDRMLERVETHLDSVASRT